MTGGGEEKQNKNGTAHNLYSAFGLSPQALKFYIRVQRLFLKLNVQSTMYSVHNVSVNKGLLLYTHTFSSSGVLALLFRFLFSI